MKIRLAACLCVGLAMAYAWHDAGGQHLQHLHRTKAGIVCEPGFKIVEETIMQDVERMVARTVTTPKKKWVYDWVDDPFFVACCPTHGLARHHGCNECAKCATPNGPFCRKQLVKREVDDPCNTVTTIVSERIIEKVPVTVYRKVPCDTPPPKAEAIPFKPMPVK